MTLKKIEQGDIPTGDEWMMNWNELYTLTGLNLIRQLIDRDVDLANAQMDWFGDAYVDDDGRKDTVSSATAQYDTLNFYYSPVGIESDQASGDSTHDPDSFDNTSNAFDEDDGTYADKTNDNDGTDVWELGKTFNAKNIDVIRYKAYSSISVGGGSSSGFNSEIIMKIQTYNGSSWNDEETLYDYGEDASISQTVDGVYVLDKSVQGIRIYFSLSSGADGFNDHTARLYYLEYGDASTSSKEITHDIPAGTFSSTISKTIGVPFIEDWEDGADIQYKLTNSTEDSGWLNTNEVSEFTAFTAEPETMIVKLIPKDSNPTAGFPSVKGFLVRGSD